MGKSGYTSLSIDEKRYSRMRRNWDSQVAPDTDLTFTEWHTQTVESAIERIKFLKESYPNLTVVKVVANGVVIDDSKLNDVVKVFCDGKKIKCSVPDKPDYIIYASLHPLFTV